jgi:adenylate cyclase
VNTGGSISHISRAGRYMDVNSHAFLFADLCGFTAYTSRHGDERGAELAIAFHERVRELANAERCEVVKSIGDAVMVRSDDAHAALRLSARVIALGGIAGHPRIRIGIDVGPAVERAGDWFGSTVNTAARVAETALPGEVIVTERAGAVVTEGTGVRLLARGAPRLKGLPRTRLQIAAA